MSKRDDDILKLRYVLAPAQEPEVTEYERGAFAGMLDLLLNGVYLELYDKQARWLDEVFRRVQPISAAKVPKARAVVVPEVLRRPLPLKPPSRRREE